MLTGLSAVTPTDPRFLARDVCFTERLLIKQDKSENNNFQE